MHGERGNRSFPHVIGIVGGLGPFAHVGFERRLLELAAERFGADADADFPEWVVSSIPATPDRTAALAGRGADPTRELLRSLRRLAEAGCDFAAIVCNTAHAFLPATAGQVPLPVVHAVLEAVAAAGRVCGEVRRVGLLATTGTCRSGLFEQAFARAGVEVVRPADGGEPDDPANLQERLVTTAIYGPLRGGRRAGGIKGGDVAGARPLLLAAAGDLVESRGAEALVIGCSEISLALGAADVPVPLIDAMEVLAVAVLDLAAGKRSTADLPPPSTWPGEEGAFRHSK